MLFTKQTLDAAKQSAVPLGLVELVILLAGDLLCGYLVVSASYNIFDLISQAYALRTERPYNEIGFQSMISPEDIRWEGEDPGFSRREGRAGPGRGFKKSVGRGGGVPGAGRGRGATKGQSKKDFLPSQNGIGKKASNDIEILHIETLIKDVERVFGASHPDLLSKLRLICVMQEHEQALVDAIARLADASDGESDDGRSMDRERGWKNRKYGGNQHTADFEDDIAGEGRGDGSDGEMAGDGRVVSDDQQDGDDI
ncbi:hypothetical protein HHK36_033443 [Tetracentron sinense]|uniref:Uncharacterized protein n=1 Tax=Tetracentron sinense TaxID=13715 RepID=A0A834Y5S9_TETSI|nr:hypothetical protein HHK36_033443 [Tetracentron sinense]